MRNSVVQRSSAKCTNYRKIMVISENVTPAQKNFEKRKAAS